MKTLIRTLLWIEKTRKISQMITSVDFVRKVKTLKKFRDHWHLTGKNKRPAHSNFVINITQKQSIFLPFVFLNFRYYDCHPFFKKLFDKKKDKERFDIARKTNEEYKKVT